MDFQAIRLEDKEKMNSWLYRYGGDSCQNSFTSSYLHRAKYDDHYCFYRDFLVIYRKGISDPGEKKFLFPIGDPGRTEELKDCIDELLSLCRREKARLSFSAITPEAADFLKTHFGEDFQLEDSRDAYEYLFSTDAFVNLPGKHFEKRRWQVHRFMKEYAGRYEIRAIDQADIPRIREFYEQWLLVKGEDEGLFYEAEALKEALVHYRELDLFGILIQVDDRICGINIGCRISKDTVDGIFLKGDRGIRYIYTMLFHKFAQICCPDVPMINGEEDLGIEGLREVKQSYDPVRFIRKYTAVQNGSFS